MSHSNAFSLIELMVVITVVAVLSAVAIPSYKEYMVRAKTNEIHTFFNIHTKEWERRHNLGLALTGSITLPSSMSYLASMSYSGAGLGMVFKHDNGTYVASEALASEFFSSPPPIVIEYRANYNSANATLDWQCIINGTNRQTVRDKYFPSCDVS